MTSDPRILITGGTGRVGRAVMAALGARGVACKAMTRREQTPAGGGPNAAWAFGDYDLPDTLQVALTGVDRLFLLTPGDPEQARRECTMIEAAASAGVERVVKLSVLGADPDAPFAFGRSHGGIERVLRASGLQWTVLQPNGMFHNIATQADSIRRYGRITGCQGGGAVSLIDVRDVGAAAASALCEDVAEQTIVLTGGETLTADDQAAILSDATGRRITYIDSDPRVLRQAMLKRGLPEWLADALIELNLFYESGAARELSAGVSELTNQSPRRFADWCREQSASFEPAAHG